MDNIFIRGSRSEGHGRAPVVARRAWTRNGLVVSQDSTVKYLHEVRLPALCVRACPQVLRCQIRDITKLEINREEHFQFSDDKVQRKLLKSRTCFNLKRRRDPHTHMRCVCGLYDTPVCLMCVRVRGVLCVLCMCVCARVCVVCNTANPTDGTSHGGPGGISIWSAYPVRRKLTIDAYLRIFIQVFFF